MRVDQSSLVDDLAAEHAAVDAMLVGRPAEDWDIATPAAGWDVKDTVSHLYYFDKTARLALTDPTAFTEHMKVLFTAGLDGGLDVADGRELGGLELFKQWRLGRAELLAALAAADPSERVPWYGPAMGLASFTTARLMETWSHGQDIVDALGLEPVVSNRLKHVCHIAYGARPYSYIVNGKEVPTAPLRLEVNAPDGSLWTWGEEGAADCVSGDALDVALVTTQRRHLDDTGLKITGPIAAEWIGIAQTFAGPSGGGRTPGARRLSQSS